MFVLSALPKDSAESCVKTEKKDEDHNLFKLHFLWLFMLLFLHLCLPCNQPHPVEARKMLITYKSQGNLPFWPSLSSYKSLHCWEARVLSSLSSKGLLLYKLLHTAAEGKHWKLCVWGWLGEGCYDLGLFENVGKKNASLFPSVSSPNNARSNISDKLECSYQLWV